MTVCTFFGHRECPEEISPVLQACLRNLIVDFGASRFYVGNQGQFDTYVRRALQALREEFPHIRYAVVLANFPDTHAPDAMLPEGVAALPEIRSISSVGWRS